MEDIFGREVKRGDIIAYTKSNRSGMSIYTSTQLGIVNNILPNRKYSRGQWQHTRIEKNYNSKMNGQSLMSSMPFGGLGYPTPQLVQTYTIPDEVEIVEKVTFYIFEKGVSATLPNNARGGQYRGKIYCTNSFMIIDESTLSEDWKKAYDNVKQAYKIY